jgi:glycosyltransferase involved in cell wall biosynthesis
MHFSLHFGQPATQLASFLKLFGRLWGQEMKVSVIIPAFNRGYILGQAIQSVLDQTLVSLEVVIVDDGSTDDTHVVASSFTDPRIRVIKHPTNRGVAAARNTGILEARGELIAFLDSDDLWKPEKLSLDANFLDRNLDADAVFSDLEYQGETPAPSVVGICPSFLEFAKRVDSDDGVSVPRRVIYLSMLREMPVKIQATTFRGEALREVGLFNEDWRSGEDWELLLRFVRSRNIGYINQQLVVQRAQSDSTFLRHRKVDALFLSKMFIDEKRKLKNDREAITAARVSITRHSNQIGYMCRRDNELLAAARAYIRGFLEAGDLRLLARALNLVFPNFIRQRIISLWNFIDQRQMHTELSKSGQ